MTPALRYQLAGVLGAPDVLAAMARMHPSALVIDLDPPGLALLPVTAELADGVTPAALCALGLDRLPGGTAYSARRRETWLTGPESGFAVLTPGVAALLEAASMLGPVAYVEANHLGLTGRQAAAVWRSGRLLTGPLLLSRQEEYDAETAPIGVALRALGVTANGDRDEFAVSGLGRHPRTTDWLDRATP